MNPIEPPPRSAAFPAAAGGQGARPLSPAWLDDAPVTRMLLAINVAVFVAEVAITHAVMDLPTRQALELGASYSLSTVGELRVETLVTACFLHAGLLHLAFNMLALWQAGPLVERAVGSARMAPMYLLAGAFGNVLSVAYGWTTRSDEYSVGASGAISGVFAAALVLGWRLQGWRGPLTQAMARWLGFVILFGAFSSLSGGHIDNAAHVGGAVAGGTIAAMWKRGDRYSEQATRAIVAVSWSILVACIVVVSVRDRTDRFATMMLQERRDFAVDALNEGRCRDAREGIHAVERLRARMSPVTSLRRQLEATCGEGFGG